MTSNKQNVWCIGLSKVQESQEKRARRINNTLSKLRTQLTRQFAKSRDSASGSARRQVAATNAPGGFTIVELLVGISVGSILFIAFMVAISNEFVLIVKNNANIDMSNASQNLLRSTVENLRSGDGIRTTNAISDAHAPVGGWNTNNNSFVIVVDTPALNSSHNYIIDPNTGSPYMNELVYYKSSNSLLIRSLANPSANGNTLTTSCPQNLASQSCPADRDLGDYFHSMSFSLYDQNNDATADPTQARLIKINLTMQRTIFGENVSLANTIAVTLRNRF